jgi:hypothetical protein
LGYSWTAQTARLRLLAELSSWMAGRGFEAEDLTAPLMKGFLDGARVSCPGAQWCSPTSERQVLAYLRGLGLVAAPEATVLTDPVDLLVAEFVEYLVRERGLVAGSSTVHGYERTPVCSWLPASILIAAALSAWQWLTSRLLCWRSAGAGATG